MAKQKKQLTKKKIVTAAWKLFYRQGYDDTTVDEIIREAGTSKGTFYHYFDGKDALLSSLSYLFDDKYEELLPTLDKEGDSFGKMMYLNRELFGMIETSVSRELLASLYSSQLITRGEKHLLDQNRLYYRLLNEIVSDGQKRGELTTAMSSYEITKLYALCERALLYDWCICNGEYSLKEYGAKTMPMLLHKIRKDKIIQNF
ncbi:MAG: helix-turn-helix transcriptional regulator [Lachnospiraceae bacterium]|nr:helix-turn-helix transcriptional regulator [Lachnospiraceae bacterium]